MYNFEDKYIVDDIYYAYNSELLLDEMGKPYISFLASNGDYVKHCIFKSDCIDDTVFPLNCMVHIEGSFEGTELIVRECHKESLLNVSLEKFFKEDIPTNIKYMYVSDFLHSLGTPATDFMCSMLNDFGDALKLTYVPIKTEHQVSARKEIIDNIFKQVSYWADELEGHMDLEKIDIFFVSIVAAKLAEFFMLDSNPVSWQNARFEKMISEIKFAGNKAGIDKQIIDDITFMVDFCSTLNNDEICKKLFKPTELKSNLDS